MNGMFSNSRGLKDLAKHLHIVDCITEHCLDLLGISETGKRDFTGSLLNRISGGVDFSWFSRPPRSRSGGILLCVRTSTMEVLLSRKEISVLNSTSVTSPTISFGAWSLYMVLPRQSTRLLLYVNWLTWRKIIPIL
jgi:hypothetical protein